LYALAYPPAMILVPVFALWWWWSTGRDLAAGKRAATAFLAGVAVISPATIHNYQACGEIIPISAQAGVTFAHGNAPGSTGKYTKLLDVSGRRDTQNADTRRVYQEATGREPTWNAVNRYFFKRGLDYWRSQPSEAVRLFGKKAWWFLSGRNYSEIYWPTLERGEGFLTGLYLTPLPTAWLIPPALVALAVWLRRLKKYGPELMLFGLPLLIVVVFWYSPRYRFPAVPVIVVACSWALWQAVAWRQHRSRAVAVGVAVAVGLGLGFFNRAIGFDSLEQQRGIFWAQVGDALRMVGRDIECIEAYQKGLELKPENAVGAANLSRVLMKHGRLEEAEAYLGQALRYDPRNALMHYDLGRVLVVQRRPAEALEQFQEALRWDPTFLLAREQETQLLLARGDIAGGIASLREAHELAPGRADLTNGLAWLLATTPGLTEADRVEALRCAREAVATLDRADPGALDTLAAALAANSKFAEAVATIEQAIALAEELGEPELAARFRARLELYQAGQPYLEHTN
ncbi:MAG: tetratricopeptide repeat protein, partial [Phycisphaerae bacterium]|nr:tetratricopeptide repeat protein [Phycisphaerae bacterium]